MSIAQNLRSGALSLPESGIVSVVTHGRSKPGLIPLWAGEGDKPTPSFISEAARKALADGETFYTWQRGIPELREALARYHTRHFGKASRPEEFIVTGSGMQSIQMAINAVAGAGDEVLYLSPAWPNFAAAVMVVGAKPVAVKLVNSTRGWSCDLDRLRAAITPRTKAIFVNTPSNPTGWTADRETLAALLDIAREKNLWLIADEIYSLFFYDGERAPSFMDVMEPADRILFVNSFSKNWAMTGWRVGWLRIHPDLQQVFENLVQYSTSGVAVFAQRGAVAALDGGDEFIANEVRAAAHARDVISQQLLATGKVELTAPAGGYYLFFRIAGAPDSQKAAFDIVDEANVGLAPGTAFGPGGEEYFRLCFNRRLDHLEEAAARLATWIEKLPGQ